MIRKCDQESTYEMAKEKQEWWKRGKATWIIWFNWKQTELNWKNDGKNEFSILLVSLLIPIIDIDEKYNEKDCIWWWW